jgi:hypothetical protein
VTHPQQPSVERKPLTDRLHTWAGIGLLAGVVGACAKQVPTPEPAIEHGVAGPGAALQGRSAPVALTPAASTSAAATTAAAPVAAGEPAPDAQRRVPRSYLLTHYADSVGMRRALINGKLDDFRAAAAALAKAEGTPPPRAEYRMQVDAVRVAARSAREALSIGAGAVALGKLGAACASCHLKFGGPDSPVAPQQLSEHTDPSMVAHAAATDRLWEGLIFPSDSSWASGMDGLLDAPKLDSDVADVAAAARHLRELAGKGKSAGVEQRAAIFASVLTTCTGCHARVGVSVRSTPSL